MPPRLIDLYDNKVIGKDFRHLSQKDITVLASRRRERNRARPSDCPVAAATPPVQAAPGALLQEDPPPAREPGQDAGTLPSSLGHPVLERSRLAVVPHESFPALDAFVYSGSSLYRPTI